MLAAKILSAQKENLGVYFYCFAIIFGPAFTLFLFFPYAELSVDIQTYLSIAHLDFNESPIRRYRVIVPFIASGIDLVFKPFLEAFKSNTFQGKDFSLGFSFLLVNTSVMALFGLYVFKFLKLYNTKILAALIGLTAILTSKWVAYMAGLPWIDSLYLLMIIFMLYGIVSRKNIYLFISVFIGPWAKESYIFFVPLIFFFSDVPKVKLVLVLLLSGMIVFSFRFYIDYHFSLPIQESFKDDLSHLEDIGYSLRKIFCAHGIYEIFMVYGFWTLVLFSYIKKSVRDYFTLESSGCLLLFWSYFTIVLIHVLLSSDLSRMFYISSPIFALLIAKSFERLQINFK